MWILIAGFFKDLWARFALYITLAGTFIFVVLGAWMKGRSDGKEVYKRKAQDARIKAIETSRKVTDEIANARDADADKRYRRWLRD